MKTFKKATLTTLALLGACSMNFVTATTSTGLVSIDSRYIFQNSAAGKTFISKTQQKIDAFQETVRKAQQDLATFQDEIEKQRSILSKEALTEKEEQLLSKRKKTERDLTQQEEELRRVIQKDQIKLIEDQQKVYAKAAQEEGWLTLIDKNAPGVIYVAETIDKSDYILNKYLGAADNATTSKAPVTFVQKEASDAAKAIKAKTAPAKDTVLVAKTETKSTTEKTSTNKVTTQTT